jgi:hypothetical protein
MKRQDNKPYKIFKGAERIIRNLNRRTLTIYVCVIFWLFCFFVMILNVKAATIYLEDIDSGTASPTGEYRWLDVANQAYCSDYRHNYNYTQATVEINYNAIGETFNGILDAFNLKPNFAYQLKLVGTPGTTSNEKIGLVGRWWQEEWSGSAWTNGQNLNNKGNGSSPNPNDYMYYARKYITDPASPTGYKYKFTGYLVFDYFITDENGNATVNFEINSSCHVLWKTTQRVHTIDDGLIKSTTFDVNISSPAYDVDYPIQTVEIFGEWERRPVGGIFPQPGNYSAEILLTEESFHGDGGSYSGNWAGAMGNTINFIIPDVCDVLSLQHQWNLISFSSNVSVDKTAIQVLYNFTNYNWTEAVSNGIVLNFLYGWNKTNQSYSLEDILKPGDGYWCWAYYSCTLLVLGSVDEDEFITNLQTYWNCIGTPFDASLIKENILVRYNGINYSWYNATTNNNEEGEPLILSFIYYWDTSSHTYQLSDVVLPRQGYWIYAYYSCTFLRPTI